MKQLIVSILTRVLLGLIAVDVALMGLSLLYPHLWAMVVITFNAILVGGLAWVFLVMTYLPELIAIRSTQGAMVLAHWRMVQDISFLPISATNTCTGTTEAIEDLTSSMSGSRSSY